MAGGFEPVDRAKKLIKRVAGGIFQESDNQSCSGRRDMILKIIIITLGLTFVIGSYFYTKEGHEKHAAGGLRFSRQYHRSPPFPNSWFLLKYHPILCNEKSHLSFRCGVNRYSNCIPLKAQGWFFRFH